MAQMKRSTLVRKMLMDPGAVREFLDCTSTAQRATWFPDHDIMVKTREVTNLLSGKKVIIAANTPLCCDPSSETYWSM
jgi:hypothetical protein